MIDCPNEEQDQDQDDNEERKEKYSSKNVKIYKEFYGNNIINERNHSRSTDNQKRSFMGLWTLKLLTKMIY